MRIFHRAFWVAALALAVVAASPARAAFFTFDVILTNFTSGTPGTELPDTNAIATVSLTPGVSVITPAAVTSLSFAPTFGYNGTVGFLYDGPTDTLTIGVVTDEAGDTVDFVGFAPAVGDFVLVIAGATGPSINLTLSDFSTFTAGNYQFSDITLSPVVAVPEPATLLLFGSALAGLLVGARRRREIA